MSSLSSSFTLDHLYLSPNAPEKPYRRRTGEEKKSVHWGQRKLFLSELYFLSCYWKQANIVVYAGASPGTHLNFLSELFPTVIFHLYDPAPFHVKASDKIHLYQQEFTDTDAQQWANRSDVLFISDIRTSDYTHLTPEDNEKMILSDMRMQQQWYRIMTPVRALLKFRLPYPSVQLDGSNVVRYLKGQILLQPWSPQTTTETRLIPSGQDEIDWNIVQYESQMFYHNTEVREHHQYMNPMTLDLTPIDPPELLNDFDSVAELVIIQHYLASVNKPLSPKMVSRQITHRLTQHQHYKMSIATLRQGEIKSSTKLASLRHQGHQGHQKN